MHQGILHEPALGIRRVPKLNEHGSVAGSVCRGFSGTVPAPEEAVQVGQEGCLAGSRGTGQEHRVVGTVVEELAEHAVEVIKLLLLVGVVVYATTRGRVGLQGLLEPRIAVNVFAERTYLF